jgi:hypothetical protein
MIYCLELETYFTEKTHTESKRMEKEIPRKQKPKAYRRNYISGKIHLGSKLTRDKKGNKIMIKGSI